MFFDSHCHLTDERLAAEVGAVVARARAAGVVGIVSVGTDPDDAELASRLAAEFEGLWAAVGIHPHVSAGADAVALARVTELARRPEVVALGETGLDYHYDNSPRPAQRKAFDAHLALASETGLPVIIHSRDADEDTSAVIRAAPAGVVGVLHCFTGGADLLETAIDAGWYISFAGMVTFAKYADGDLVRAVPPERLLIETDSPYLAPVPRRGRRNEPAYVRHVAQGVARWLGEPLEAVAERTLRNARSFYRLET